MKKLSLRKRLLLSITTISAFGAVLILAMALKTGGVVDSGKEASVRLAARSLMDALDGALAERFRETQSFTMSDVVRSGDPARLIPYLNELMAGYGRTYPALIVINKRGKVISANTVDADGRALGNEQILGRDVSHVAWFERAARDAARCSGGRAAGSDCFWLDDGAEDSDLARSFGQSGKLVSLTVGIRHARSGDVLGFWSARVSWDAVFAARVEEARKRLQGDWLPQLFLRVQNAQGRTLLGPEGWTAQGRDESARRTNLETTGFRGEVFESSAKSASGGWTVTAAVPTGDAIHAFNRWALVFGLVFAVLAAASGWWVVQGAMGTFNGVIYQLNDQSDHLKSASGQLTTASQDLAQSATQQAASLQETAASIEEISSMVNRSAENAERSIRIAESSQTTATRGKKVVDEMIAAIGEITTSNGAILKQIETGNQQLTDIIKVISEIGNKTKVINDIAFQTKLLSFNASVEAARAGEHGKGFAVVAEEVGSLAQMSGSAAKDIGDMLSGSIQTVQGIVDSSRSRVERLIEEGRAKIESGIQVARQCEAVLEEIVKAEAQMNSVIAEITSASREQAQGISEITRAIGQLDQSTNRNAAISQQTEQFAEAIAYLAEALKEQVGEFEVLVTGHRSSGSLVPVRMPASAPHPGAPAYPDNVIPLRAETEENRAVPQRRAIADSDDVPSESDPRFKEI